MPSPGAAQSAPPLRLHRGWRARRHGDAAPATPGRSQRAHRLTESSRRTGRGIVKAVGSEALDRSGAGHLARPQPVHRPRHRGELSALGLCPVVHPREHERDANEGRAAVQGPGPEAEAEPVDDDPERTDAGGKGASGQEEQLARARPPAGGDRDREGEEFDDAESGAVERELDTGPAKAAQYEHKSAVQQPPAHQHDRGGDLHSPLSSSSPALVGARTISWARPPADSTAASWARSRRSSSGAGLVT